MKRFKQQLRFVSTGQIFGRSSPHPSEGSTKSDDPTPPPIPSISPPLPPITTPLSRPSSRPSSRHSSRPTSLTLETSDSDPESRYEDASPMYEKPTSDDENNLYADVDNIIDRNSQIIDDFEYDIPKISFSFFEPGLEEMFPENEHSPTIKSEVRITLAMPDNRTLDVIEEKPESDNAETGSTDGNTYEFPQNEILEVTLEKCDSKELKVTPVTKCDSVPNFESTASLEELYKVPTKSYRRLSQSLDDFGAPLDIPQENCADVPELPPPRTSIQHHVVLSLPHIRSVSQEDCSATSSKLEYCDARSKLPAQIRRPTLLRRPHVRLNPSDTIANIKSKVGGFIQKAPTDKLQHFEQVCRAKYKDFFTKNTARLFKRRLSKSSSTGDDSSQIVKNDAFFDKVDMRDVHDGGEGNDVNDAVTSSNTDERSDFDFNTLKTAFRRSKFIAEGQNGFEDLRRFVKTGGDFCKELSAILQERSEAEQQYAKCLSKLSGKLARACRDGVGGINEAWKYVAQDMEVKSEIHKQFSSALSEDIVKPLKQLTEAQHKCRKHVEGGVDKTAKGLSDWRAAEAKGKKQSHMCARDNEKLQDALLDAKLSRSTSLIQLAHMHNHKTLSDKESAKLQGKKRKAEDAVKKADIEYYTLCVRSERSRLDWESAVIRGSNTFQMLEEERLNNLKSLLMYYSELNSDMWPKIAESAEKLSKPIIEADSSKDLSAFLNLRNSTQYVSEQLLPDFYCEHITLAMNRERRKQALTKLLHLIKQDLDRERKSKNGLENLSRAIKQTPNFGAEDSQQNVFEKLYHMRSMLTYLEGARYKLQSALAELEDRQRSSHPLSSHITVTRDKSGLQQSILKVPVWVRDEFIEHEKNTTSVVGDTELPDWTDRGMADGNSNQHDSDFDEFSSEGSSTLERVGGVEECHNIPLGRYKALYPYTANLDDELNLKIGDILSVYKKQDDGWWFGECNGCVGIFPATYVETIEC